MRTNAILVVIILFFGTSSTCNQNTQVNPEGFKPLKGKMDLNGFSNDCKSFIRKRIRPNWLLYSTEECYYNNQAFWESILLQKECFVGKNKNQVQSVFGKPTSVLNSTQSWENYYMGIKCEKNAQYFILQFHYDKNDVLKNIGQSQITHN